MAMVIELSDRTAARVTAAAAARGVTTSEVVEELVTAALPDTGFDHPVDEPFKQRIAAAIVEHREILDALAAT
jgi:hypothetical protein